MLRTPRPHSRTCTTRSYMVVYSSATSHPQLHRSAARYGPEKQRRNGTETSRRTATASTPRCSIRRIRRARYATFAHHTYIYMRWHACSMRNASLSSLLSALRCRSSTATPLPSYAPALSSPAPLYYGRCWTPCIRRFQIGEDPATLADSTTRSLASATLLSCTDAHLPLSPFALCFPLDRLELRSNPSRMACDAHTEITVRR
jgi:hypothetical protein